MSYCRININKIFNISALTQCPAHRQTILVLFGVIGNGIVIYAATQYSAFNLDSVTVYFVQQLAIADMVYSVLITFPCALTHIARGWVLGFWSCVVYGYVTRCIR